MATAAMLSIDACQELRELGWKMLLQVLLLSPLSLHQTNISLAHCGSYSPQSPEYLSSALAPVVSSAAPAPALCIIPACRVALHL